MKLSQIRHVLAVAESGSLRAAGRQLNIAQPAITRSIRDIEQELGVPLFERSVRGVHLTPMGKVFVRRAQTVQSELRRAREEIDQLKGRMVGQVNVALSTAPSLILLPKVLVNFERAYPDVVVTLTESLFAPIAHDLLDGKIDFFVGPIEPGFMPKEFDVEPLFDSHRVVLARRGHSLASARRLEELAGARWVRSTHVTEDEFALAFTRLGLPAPQVVLNAASAHIRILAVIESDLLTIVPAHWISFAPMADRLVALELEPSLSSTPICIVRNKNAPLTPLAEYMSDLMRRAGGIHAERTAMAAVKQ